VPNWYAPNVVEQKIMVSLAQIQSASDRQPPVFYQCQDNLNLYDSPALESLATQAIATRQLQVLAIQPPVLQIRLCEDGYPGWIAVEDLDLLVETEAAYEPIAFDRSAISDRLPQIIEFAHRAMAQPNYYLWGGTVGPNYDCSGLMQAAFLSVGIWLPRDAYQQEGFVAAIALTELEPGDLVFFGTPEKATHVGLYLGGDRYIHSSGKAQGRNGIGIDWLRDEASEPVSQAYFRQLRGAGRVMAAFCP
jgi:hypothetical protein